VPVDGTRVVAPGATTTYTLTATGPGGTATASVTVTVVPPVSITRFEGTTGNCQPINLSWICSGGTDARVTLSRSALGSPGIILVSDSPNLSGTYSDTAVAGANATYEYTLRVRNAAGQTASQSRTIGHVCYKLMAP
jgi:hypothetical protein